MTKRGVLGRTAVPAHCDDQTSCFTRVGNGGGVSGCLLPPCSSKCSMRAFFFRGIKQRSEDRAGATTAMVLSLPDCMHPPPFTTLRSISCMSDLTFFFSFCKPIRWRRTRAVLLWHPLLLVFFCSLPSSCYEFSFSLEKLTADDVLRRLPLY